MTAGRRIGRLWSAFRKYRALSPGLKRPGAYWNFFRARREMRRMSSRVRAKPLKVTIDIANACQLRCPLCPTGLGAHDRPPSRTGLEAFERLMGEIGPDLFVLDLFNWGEPTLNKNLPDFLRVAREHRVSTSISSNFSIPLKDDYLRSLIESGLNYLVVALDGATAETAGTYRRRVKFDTVLHNMRRIVEMKREMNSRSPYVDWRFLVFRFNEHEIDKATAMAREIGVDRITFAPPYLDTGDYPIPPEDRALVETWEPTDPAFSRYETTDGELQRKSTAGKRCDWHYMSSAINADGKVAPCCGLYHVEHDFGSIGEKGETPYMDVVNNDDYVAIRDRFAGRRDEPTGLICETCPAPDIQDLAVEVSRLAVMITAARVLDLGLAPIRALGRLLRLPVSKGRTTVWKPPTAAAVAPVAAPVVP